VDQLVNRSIRIARGLTYPIFLELNRIGLLFGEHTRLFEERWRFPALSCQICDGEEQTQLLKNILEAAGFVSFMVLLCFVSGRWAESSSRLHMCRLKSHYVLLQNLVHVAMLAAEPAIIPIARPPCRSEYLVLKPGRTPVEYYEFVDSWGIDVMFLPTLAGFQHINIM
jgi:hypothetical protein